MSELQCSREVGGLRSIYCNYSRYRKSSHSIKLITDWNDKKDHFGQYPVQMHIKALCFERWTSELNTRYSMIRLLVCWHYNRTYEPSLLEQRDRKLSTGRVRTPSEEIVVRRLSKFERSNYSGANGICTFWTNVGSSQSYLIVRERKVARN